MVHEIKDRRIFGARLLDTSRNSKTHCGNRRGQVTIWIIIGLVLVGSMVLFFTLDSNPKPGKLPEGNVAQDIESFLDGCFSDEVEDISDSMLYQGGFLLPKNAVFFNNTNIEYICKNKGFYLPCINQHPMLIDEFEEQIYNQIFPKVGPCFDKYKEEVEGRGVDVFLEGDPVLDVQLGPDRIFLNIKREVTIRELGDASVYDNFNIEIVSPAHNLLSVAREIADQEARFCYFEFVGYSVFYPRFKITKSVMSDPTKIYTIEDTKSGKIMNTAVRSCAIPPGGLV